MVSRTYYDEYGRKTKRYDVEDGKEVRLAQSWEYNDTNEEIVVPYEVDGEERTVTVGPGGLIRSIVYMEGYETTEEALGKDINGDGDTLDEVQVSDYQEVTYYDHQKPIDAVIENREYSITDDVDLDPEERTAYDPWTKGEIQIIDGHLAFVVNPEDVEGGSFYPTVLTGETKTDENGNYIFMLGVDDSKTKEELEALVGKEINLMWQYYTESSKENTGGYGWIWLAPTTDWRVACHLKYDNEASVEQWGGDWDRTKQYVLLD